MYHRTLPYTKAKYLKCYKFNFIKARLSKKGGPLQWNRTKISLSNHKLALVNDDVCTAGTRYVLFPRNMSFSDSMNCTRQISIDQLQPRAAFAFAIVECTFDHYVWFMWVHVCTLKEGTRPNLAGISTLRQKRALLDVMTSRDGFDTVAAAHLAKLLFFSNLWKWYIHGPCHVKTGWSFP